MNETDYPGTVRVYFVAKLPPGKIGRDEFDFMILPDNSKTLETFKKHVEDYWREKGRIIEWITFAEYIKHSN